MCSKQFLLFVALIIGVVVVNGESKDQYKIVETSNGRVRGIRNTTLLNGVPFYAFKGIPYVKAPIDDLRFKVMSFIVNKKEIEQLNEILTIFFEIYCFEKQGSRAGCSMETSCF